MIRQATENDFDAIAEMAKDFWRHTVYDDPFCKESTIELLNLCLSHELLFVAESKGKVVGFVAGVLSPLLANKRVIMGQELAWWVEPEHRNGKAGIGLLKAIEKKAKEVGAKYWNMAFMYSSMPEKIEGMYKKMGYKKTESFYTRAL